WQRDRLAGAVLADQLAYWRRQLAGVEPLELPTDRPRPAVQTRNGAVHGFAVPAPLTGRLRDLAARHDGTLFMTLVAACQVLLHRSSGQADTAVPTGVGGRQRSERARRRGLCDHRADLPYTLDTAAPAP